MGMDEAGPADADRPDADPADAADGNADDSTDASSAGQGRPLEPWDPAFRASPRSPHRDRAFGAVLLALIVVVAVLALVSATPTRPDDDRTGARPADAPVVIHAGATGSWDPARIGDAASSALLAQTWDGLTTLDGDGVVRPSLADRWSVEDGGRRIVFHLRDGAAFSDGSPVTPDDVRRSWARLLDPAHPSPLASLVTDIRGARAILAGDEGPATLGVHGDGRDVIVELDRPAAWLPSAAGAPSLAIIARGIGSAYLVAPPSRVPVSGAWIPAATDDEGYDFVANERWWGGAPPLPAVRVLGDGGGRSAVELFRSGDVDWTEVADGDATWLRWDATLGPSLRHSADLSVRVLGFDATVAPFDDRRVRRAIALAVDRQRIVTLAGERPAGSLVPEGIPLRASEDVAPPWDPQQARRELAAAGYPGGRGFPTVVLAGSGNPWEEAIARELERELGIRVSLEIIPFSELEARLGSGPPMLWTMEWIADYPHPYDFLGLLLGEGSPSNWTGWTDARFEAALDAAASTDDPVAQQAAYLDASRIVRDEVPMVPIAYGETWVLARDGLLGADPGRLGRLRFAGLAWADGS